MKLMKLFSLQALLLTMFIICNYSCQKEAIHNKKMPEESTSAIVSSGFRNEITNSRNGAEIRLYSAQYITDGSRGRNGNIIYFFNDRGNRHSGIEFVAGDPRREGRNYITYAIDDEATTDNNLSTSEVNTAINNAMQTWNAAECSDFGLRRIPISGNYGESSYWRGFGGKRDIVADITHCGFLPEEFFLFMGPNIVAVTFASFYWDPNKGEPSDIDNDKQYDMAFAEIYYNDKFSWQINGQAYDIETVALHESGHGLGQDHFGTAFLAPGNGNLMFSPRAVMNAAYVDVQRNLLGSDLAGHCSIWSNWPNR